jgi:hypothetical protein
MSFEKHHFPFYALDKTQPYNEVNKKNNFFYFSASKHFNSMNYEKFNLC